MGEDLAQRPIVIKRIKKVAGGHHGGAWKIAYADFVTAMMAFFLLMWLLGSSTKAKLEGISEYFKTPLKVALSGGSSVANTDSILVGGGEDFT
ncbi:MAG: motility protein MotB, partial [Nitrosomonas sp.]|nr:motility protein MotB [Nitrosomonas sp.]